MLFNSFRPRVLTTVSDINQTICSKYTWNWSTDEVQVWLKLIGYSHFGVQFRENEVDGESLLCFEDNDWLELCIDLSKEENRLFKHELEQLKQKRSNFSYPSKQILQFHIRVNSSNVNKFKITDHKIIYDFNNPILKFSDFIREIEIICGAKLHPKIDYICDGELIRITNDAEFFALLHYMRFVGKEESAVFGVNLL